MAQSIEKQIKASQKFLLGLRALPAFAELKTKQRDVLLKVIDKAVGLATEKVADLLSLLDSEIWGEDLAGLQSKLSEKTQDEVSTGNRSLQDWTMLPHVLDESMWNMLQTSANPQTSLEKLTKYCGQLGLRCPNEFTYGALLQLTYCTFGRSYTDPEKKQLLDQQKGRIKRWLSGYPEPSVYMVELPSELGSLPEEVLRQVFPNGFKALSPPGVDLAGLVHLIRQFPVRKNNSRVLTAKTFVADAPGLNLEAVGSLVRGLIGPQRDHLHLPATVPSGPARSSGTVAEEVRPLALMDKPYEAPQVSDQKDAPLLDTTQACDGAKAIDEPVVAEPARPTAEKTQGTISEALTQLRQGLIPTQPLERSVDEVKQVGLPAAIFKRPGARGRPRKRPAAAGQEPEERAASPDVSEQEVSVRSSEKKRPVQKRKRPAAAPKLKPQAKKQAKKLSSQVAAKKAKLAEVVPDKLIRKYRGGCKRCRNTPYCCNSCWRLRGFDV